VLVYQYVRVNSLKIFVETESAPSLSTIAKELACPSFPKDRRPLFPQQGSKARRNTVIFNRMHLHVTTSLPPLNMTKPKHDQF
jgi:hypothetical protein